MILQWLSYKWDCLLYDVYNIPLADDVSGIICDMIHMIEEIRIQYLCRIWNVMQSPKISPRQAKDRLFSEGFPMTPHKGIFSATKLEYI